MAKGKPMVATKTFFITGISSGLGRSLATEALAVGHRVVGTVCSEAARAEFEPMAPGLSFGRMLHVTDYARVPAVVAETEAQIGPIDVPVNNADESRQLFLDPRRFLRNLLAGSI
jgi:NAD(P)-dependent dehydrogenase (short-subunit alcohol dehydrogenase family)